MPSHSSPSAPELGQSVRLTRRLHWKTRAPPEASCKLSSPASSTRCEASSPLSQPQHLSSPLQPTSSQPLEPPTSPEEPPCAPGQALPLANPAAPPIPGNPRPGTLAPHPTLPNVPTPPPSAPTSPQPASTRKPVSPWTSSVPAPRHHRAFVEHVRLFTPGLPKTCLAYPPSLFGSLNGRHTRTCAKCIRALAPPLAPSPGVPSPLLGVSYAGPITELVVSTPEAHEVLPLLASQKHNFQVLEGFDPSSALVPSQKSRMLMPRPRRSKRTYSACCVASGATQNILLATYLYRRASSLSSLLDKALFPIRAPLHRYPSWAGKGINGPPSRPRS